MKQKNNRHQARLYAFQNLYALEFHEGATRIQFPEGEVEENLDKNYAQTLIEGVRSSLADIDAVIQAHSAKRKVERLAGVDRNILRIAIWEMTMSDEKLAPGIVINEAVTLAKEYAGENAHKFIHAVLDAVAKEQR